MYKEILSERLKVARNGSGLSQEQVAKIINIARTNIGKYENGNLEPSIETLGQLATLYRVSVDWLLGLKETGTTEQIG